jgi:transposase
LSDNISVVFPFRQDRSKMSHLRRFRRQKGKTTKQPKSSPGKPNAPECVELERGELEAILERAKASLNQDEYDTLHAAMETLIFLTQELEKKHVSIQRLKQMLFGATTESTRKVMEKILDEEQQKDNPDKDDKQDKTPTESFPKAKGHGRNGTDAYSGAETVRVPHGTLKPGDACPDCKKGTVYGATPGRIIRIRGQAPLGATVYELQKLRCNLCGAIFTASAPDGIGSDKYDAESASMIALMKYGSGVPFNRLERLQGSLSDHRPVTTVFRLRSRPRQNVGNH